MQVYRRTFFSMLKGLVLAVCAAGAAYVIAGIFIASSGVVLLIALAVLVLLAYSAVFSENIRIELEGGELRVYKGRRLTHRFGLRSCSVRYQIRTEGGFPVTHDIHLYITDLKESPEDEIHIDCSPLSRRQFDDLIRRVEGIAAPDAPKLKTIKKDR